MDMILIPAGTFLRGSETGFWDEQPAHRVTIRRPFAIGLLPVSNAEYENFDPGHRQCRGRNGTAAGDDDPVRFITWNEANAYCRWRSRQENNLYRLPTEAEWEHAFRTAGDALRRGRDVETWCADWYGPYPDEPQTDPVGAAHGDARVVRGGQWQAPATGARPSVSARLGALPEDRNPAIGLRLVQGPPPRTPPVPPREMPLWARDVAQVPYAWGAAASAEPPFFAEPIPYVHVPRDADGPLFGRHNHDPALAACPNGDLLAIWYTCRDEAGRELNVAASRLRAGSDSWDAPDLFWNVPGRNNHAPALWTDASGTLYHFNGLAAEGGWQELSLILRTSQDNGRSWSAARFLAPDYRHGHQPIPSAFRAEKGPIYLPCDATPAGQGGSVLHVSADGGWTWTELNADAPPPTFTDGGRGPWIAGIHAGVAQGLGGDLVAVGRGDAIHGRLVLSRSRDGGQSWTYSATPFPPIGGGQRPVLLRLREGPLLLVSFTPGSPFRDKSGREFMGQGMFAALSDDGGATWPTARLMTDGKTRVLDGRGWTREFTLDAAHAEPAGYLVATQTPDSRVHLISSGVYYCFNLAWLRELRAGGEADAAGGDPKMLVRRPAEDSHL